MQIKLAVFSSVALVLLLNSAGVKAQDTIPKVKYNGNKLLEDQLGYTHAVKAGNTLYISGTTGTGSMADQLTTIMDDIKSTLQHYGAGFQNVVKETVYTTSLDSFMTARSVRKSYYHGDYPASTWVEVKRLLLPQFLVEIEVTAVLPPEL